MATTLDRLYVTYVDAYNGLLKIWGQPNRTCATYVEKQLLQLVPELNRSPGLSPSLVRKGMLCFAKYEDDSYYRARIISDVLNNSVLVYFIDYGNKDCIELTNIRVLSNTGDNIITTIVPQAEEYYLANIRAEAGWSQDIMNEIRRGLCYSEYKYRTVCQSGNDKLIQISYRNEDYSSFLIRQDLAKPVSVKEQMMLLKSTFKGPSMDSMGGPFRSPGIGHLSQPSGRDVFFMPNKLPLGPVPPELPNPSLQASPHPMLPQSIFPQSQTRGGIISSDRHLSLTPSQKVMFSQMGHNPMYQEAKSPPVLNNVVIEALANQLKHHLMKDSTTPTPETPASGYISQVLDVKTTHNVYISYIDDGPWSFSVQLVSNEHELNHLMDDLAAYSFQPIKLPLVLGSPCIAKSKQFDNYCRGVLVNITHNAVKVFYVDFGNTEDLPVNMIFEMPAKFFKVKTMSQKFALSGLQKIKPTEEIKNAFVEVVENELLILHVTNLEGESLPTCDLYLKDVNIKKILNQKLRQFKNWEPTQFPRVGEIENVFVTHVESPQKFYVQLKRHETDLKDLKDELANLGAIAEHFNPEEIVPGITCISLFAVDKNWYRATVTSVFASKTANIFYIDYGNTEEVDFKMLKKVSSHSIAKVSPQAIPCCLQGFENESPNPSTKDALTQLIFEKEFSMKVVSDEMDHITVQLFDNGKDMSMCLKDAINVKQTPSEGDTRDKTDNVYPESDFDIKRNNPRGSPVFGNENGYDRADGCRSRVRKDFRDDRVSWRSDDSRKDFGWKNRDDGYNIRSREGFDMKNDKYDSGKSSRYGFKSRNFENINPMDRDTRHWERNWRDTPENPGNRNYGGDFKNKPKIGETISERMKRAARENEERGLRLSEAMMTKIPVKQENIVVHGYDLQKKKVEIGSTEDVIVTYFVNPSEIYLQLVSSRDKFRDFMTDIHNYYSTKLPLLDKPKKGDVVVSKFQQDGVLYRAVVIETDPITVRYIDFGNEEISEKENLWPMDKKFLELESQCLKCTLSGIEPLESDTWPPPNSDMDKIFEHESYKCTFIKKLDDGYEVKMVISHTGVDVNDELISGGFAYSVEEAIETPNNMLTDTSMGFDLICNEVFNVFITHLVDASEFYLQIKSSEWESFGREIRKYALKEKLLSPEDRDKLKEGDLCLVKADSGAWCRAKVIEKREIKIIVRLIDYGEELSTDYEKVKPISEDLGKYPPQAIQCSLSIDKSVQNDEFTAEFSTCNKNSFSALFHEVSDQRLKLALYDADGEKLEILKSDARAPKYVRPIAELPLINRKMLVTLSQIYSPRDIYVHLLNDAAELKKLSSSLMLCHSEKEDCEMEENLSEFELYAVFSVSHSNWYRAQLLSQSDKVAKMFYIDFGLNEEVPKKNLRKLDSSFYEKYAYAKKVTLNIEYDDDSEVYITEKIKQVIAEKECIGYFVKVNDVIYAEFSVNDTFLTPQLVSDSVTEVMVDLFKSYTSKSSEKSLIKVFVSYVASPGEFWVQEETMSSELNAFQEKLQTACWDGIPKEDIAKGDIVGALFTDDLWYRALVVSVEGDIVKVFFVDYGNNFDADKKKNKFILLNEELKKPPPFARKCSLKGCWKDDATCKFEDIAMNSEKTFTLIEISDKNDTVDLLLNGSSITEQLINEGYGEKCYDDIVLITHVNSPDDFYIQKATNKGLFEMISAEILKANSFEDAVNIHVNELYCAKHPGDNSWYRAKVLKKYENNVFVHFIDYGNCSSVTNIKQLPPDLKTPYPLATNCRLVKEQPDDTWSKAACIALKNYANVMLLKMQIVKQESGIETILLFTENGEDLTEILAKAKKDVVTARKSELSDSETMNNTKDDTSSYKSDDVFIASTESPSCEDETEDDMISVEISGENPLKTSDISNKTKDLPKCATEENVFVQMSPGEKPIKDNKKDVKGSAKKLSHWEKIAPGCVSRGPSLEEVSTRNFKRAEKLKETSVSAPVTPSVSKRNGQPYNKFQRKNKPWCGFSSNRKLSGESNQKNSNNEERVGANVNGNIKDIQN